MRKRERLIRVLFVLSALVFVVLFLALCRIKTVTVEGNEYSSSESVVSSAAIKLKSHIYSIDKDAIEKRIKAANPYVVSVAVRRRLPSTLRLIVTEDKPSFYSLIGDKFCVISCDMRVLETADSATELSSRGLIPIMLPEVKSAEPGKKIIFTDDGGYAADTTLIKTIMSSELSKDVTSVDISRRFNINVTYKSKYTIVFGNAENLTKKINFCLKTIKYLEESMPGVSGIIHAERSDETSFEITGTAG